MRYFKAILILIIINSSIYAQEDIDFKYSRDYKRILEMTKMDTSALFYPKLYKRFLAADSTLTNYEVLALQIGYTDNDNYWPYQDIEMEREIWGLNEQKEYEKAIKTCDTLLSRNPYNLLACREKSYAFKKLGQPDSADYYFDRFDKIVCCDLATGDGNTYETSWFVISPADGQWIIQLAFQGSICFMGSGQDKDENFHDILGYKSDEEDDSKSKKRKKENDCLHLYFNIEHAANRMFGKDGMKQMEELLKNKD
jgi:tetratricopeptide (TPR) repeat protein